MCGIVDEIAPQETRQGSVQKPAPVGEALTQVCDELSPAPPGSPSACHVVVEGLEYFGDGHGKCGSDGQRPERSEEVRDPSFRLETALASSSRASPLML